MEQAAKRNDLNGVVICTKARKMHKQMRREIQEISDNPSQKEFDFRKVVNFKASWGWFRYFKKKSFMKKVKLH